MLLNSFEYDVRKALEESTERMVSFFRKYGAKLQIAYYALMGTIAGWMFASPAFGASAAVSGGTNEIVNKIAQLVSDFYNDFVFLSLGVLAAVVVYHLIRIMMAAGDDRERSLHTRAIVVAIIAFFVINVFLFIVRRLLEVTGGRNTLDNSKLFNTDGTP